VGCRSGIGRLRGFRCPRRGITGCEVLRSHPLGTGTLQLHLRDRRRRLVGEAAPPHRAQRRLWSLDSGVCETGPRWGLRPKQNARLSLSCPYRHRLTGFFYAISI
jgi:hypothetical protein